MKAVYEQFFRRKRQTGAYLYPAKERKPNQTSEQAQLASLRQVLQVAISSAGDRLSVSKPAQIDDARERWAELAVQLRALAQDLTQFIGLGQWGFGDYKSRRKSARDILGLLHVANWLDSQVAALRRPGDPLLVEKHRGDPIVRAVQTLIGITLQELFGARLDGTAATLASAALGAKTSARVSRSALTAKKPKKKRTAR